MAISTSLQFTPIQTRVPFAAGALPAGELFHDHFVASQPSGLTLLRPNFQTMSSTVVPPELGLDSWPSILSNLNFGPAANESSWVAEHKEFERECYYCTGTGKCQHDDVAGSGKVNGEDDWEFCGGSGKCEHCGGDGDMGN